MRGIVIILVLFTLLSCGELGAKNSMAVWSIKNNETSELQQIGLDDIPKAVIDVIHTDYQQNPRDASYTDLILFSAFIGDTPNQRVLIFDILYVDDIKVVYVVDDTGLILEKYLHSSWQ